MSFFYLLGKINYISEYKICFKLFFILFSVIVKYMDFVCECYDN